MMVPASLPDPIDHSFLPSQREALGLVVHCASCDRLRDEWTPGAFFHLIAPAALFLPIVYLEKTKTPGASIADCEAALVHRLPFI